MSNLYSRVFLSSETLEHIINIDRILARDCSAQSRHHFRLPAYLSRWERIATLELRAYVLLLRS